MINLITESVLLLLNFQITAPTSTGSLRSTNTVSSCFSPSLFYEAVVVVAAVVTQLLPFFAPQTLTNRQRAAGSFSLPSSPPPSLQTPTSPPRLRQSTGPAHLHWLLWVTQYTLILLQWPLMVSVFNNDDLHRDRVEEEETSGRRWVWRRDRRRAGAAGAGAGEGLDPILTVYITLS